MSHIKSRKHAVARAMPPLTAAATLMALALPAVAQNASLPPVQVRDSASEDYKVEKSANPKFTAPLVDTPQTISVIRKEVLQQQGAVSLGEALRNTPGITFTMGENGNTQSGDSITMRGFDTQGSIYVDGVRDLGAVTRDTFNLEQIEVVKGSSGSDVGRAAASGYINLVSKVPQADNFFAGSASFGSADRHRLTADLNRTLSLGGGTSAVRLNLMEQNGGVAGRDWVKNKSIGIAPSFAWGLGTPTRVFVSHLYTKQDNRPDGGVPTVGLPSYYYAITPSGDAASRALQARQSFAGQTAGAPDSSNFYGSISDFDKIEANMFTARVEHDLSPGTTIRNTFRYGKTEQFRMVTSVIGPTFTTPGNPFSYTVSRNRSDGQNRNSDGGQGRFQTNEILTNQTNISAEFLTGSLKHNLNAGLELIRETQDKRHLMYATGGTGANNATTPAANLYNPDPFFPLIGYSPTQNGSYDKGETTTIGLYAFDTLKINEAFQLTGGVRVDKYRTSFSNFRVPLGAAGTTPAAPASAAWAKDSDTLFSWKLGAVYKPAPNGSIYLSYAASQRPPGGDSFTLSTSNTSGDNPIFNPQKSRNIELGTKWDFLDSRLALTGAIFDTVNRNENVTDSVTGVSEQVGKRRVRGLELGVVGQITSAWQVTAGYAYLDAKILRGTVGSATATTDGPLQWTPKNAFTAWTTYRLPMGLTIGGGARYQDGVTRSSAANPATANGIYSSEDYWVVDGMLGYEINKNVSLQFNAYNLFNKKYIERFNNGGSRYQPGTPRSYMLTANVKF
ncbi:MAG: catecholate siderophore receptor Fiu [Comamonadaceae bacterium]|nr:MAG: catecholate siderophore receptor Fiu [Comamonadaceae bacterium]